MADAQNEGAQPATPPATPDTAPDETTGTPPDETPETQTEADDGSSSPPPPETPAAPPDGPAGALTPEQLEKRLTALGKEATRHMDRVAAIMEEDAVLLVPCPLCEPNIPGLVMAGMLKEERRENVRVFMGDAAKRELRRDPFSQRCEVCDGWGEVDTTAHVDGYAVLPCIPCSGRGVVGERFEGRPAPPATPALSPLANGGQGASTTPPPAPAADLPPDVLAALRSRNMMAIPLGASGG